MRSLRFVKLEGCGNYFIVAQDLQRAFYESSANFSRTAAHLQDRNFGISADGLLLVTTSKEADFEVLMFNPDGSWMGMCGNGIRCVTRFLFLDGLVTKSKQEIRFIVEGREIVCHTQDEGRTVSVEMGAPSFDPTRIPLQAPGEFIEQEIPGFHYRGTCLSMGNPHCVIFVDKFTRVDLHRDGPLLEHHALFPKRANIEFAYCHSAERCTVQVWERGAGPTLACGTGACAVVVAGHRTGRLAANALVELPGGVLQINYDVAHDQVLLTGPAREVVTGEFCPDFLVRSV